MGELAWATFLGVTNVPATNNIVFTYKDMPVERYSWVPIEIGEIIPNEAVYAGVSGDDDDGAGPLYVGRFNGQPGKITCNHGKKMRSCCIRQEDEEKEKTDSAEILTTHFQHKWKNFADGDHEGDIFVDGVSANFVGGDMIDAFDGNLYVGKSIRDEPGKITTWNNWTLKELFTPHAGKAESGTVLVINPDLQLS